VAGLNHAAIAIPALLQSQRASNERNASTSLKTMASAEADFRSNDRDGNQVDDYWTGDVAGLFCVNPVGTGGLLDSPIKLIEVGMAGADTFNAPNAGTWYTSITAYANPSPKSGYWYLALGSDQGEPGGAVAYRQDTGGSAAMGAVHNHAKFGFLAYPDSLSAGRTAFIINENNSVFKRTLSANLRVGTASPPGTVPADASFTDWPSDVSLKAGWTPLD
jgi:hypothetical protein